MRLTTDTATAPPRSAPRGPTHTVFLVGIAAAFLLVFALDRATSSSPVQHLYYLPIVAAGATFGMSGGLVGAVVATALYHVANPHLLAFRYEQLDVLQIAIFAAAGILTARLTDDAKRLHQMAMTDDLTGLHNLRSFEIKLAAIVRACRESHTMVALLVVDLDRLKSLNDVHGHLAGAEAVRTVGHIIGARTPPDAVACRYGGDEFAIALPRHTPSLVRELADDFRQHVNDAAPVLAGIPFRRGTLSISVGVACETPATDADRTDAEAGEALFKRADAALYRAKQGGRNGVFVAESALL
jgi:diguanylate cyclase (GGDEF)-like protein